MRNFNLIANIFAEMMLAVWHAMFFAPVNAASQSGGFVPNTEKWHDIVETEFGASGSGKQRHFFGVKMSIREINSGFVHQIHCHNGSGASARRNISVPQGQCVHEKFSGHVKPSKFVFTGNAVILF